MNQQYITIAHVADVPPGTCRSIELEDAAIALFNIDGKFYALENTCPHAGGPLGDGTLEGDIISCPWHGWTFHVPTGQCLKNVSRSWIVPRYEVRIVGEAIQVFVPR